MSKFVPIHIHTEYSLLDGMIRVEDLVKYAAENKSNRELIFSIIEKAVKYINIFIKVYFINNRKISQKLTLFIKKMD